MIDLGSALAAGLSGFLAGMAFAGGSHLETVRSAIRARVLVCEGAAFVLVPFPKKPDPEPDPVRREFRPTVVPGDAA